MLLFQRDNRFQSIKIELHLFLLYNLNNMYVIY